jgi:hypothetical protein
MLAEVIQKATEEGRRQALRQTRNVVLALHSQAVSTGSIPGADATVIRHARGQQTAFETLGGWISAELGEEPEE